MPPKRTGKQPASEQKKGKEQKSDQDEQQQRRTQDTPPITSTPGPSPSASDMGTPATPPPLPSPSISLSSRIPTPLRPADTTKSSPTSTRRPIPGSLRPIGASTTRKQARGQSSQPSTPTRIPLLASTKITPRTGSVPGSTTSGPSTPRTLGGSNIIAQAGRNAAKPEDEVKTAVPTTEGDVYVPPDGTSSPTVQEGTVVGSTLPPPFRDPAAETSSSAANKTTSTRKSPPKAIAVAGDVTVTVEEPTPATVKGLEENPQVPGTPGLEKLPIPKEVTKASEVRAEARRRRASVTDLRDIPISPLNITKTSKSVSDTTPAAGSEREVSSQAHDGGPSTDDNGKTQQQEEAAHDTQDEADEFFKESDDWHSDPNPQPDPPGSLPQTFANFDIGRILHPYGPLIVVQPDNPLVMSAREAGAGEGGGSAFSGGLGGLGNSVAPSGRRPQSGDSHNDEDDMGSISLGGSLGELPKDSRTLAELLEEVGVEEDSEEDFPFDRSQEQKDIEAEEKDSQPDPSGRQPSPDEDFQRQGSNDESRQRSQVGTAAPLIFEPMQPVPATLPLVPAPTIEDPGQQQTGAAVDLFTQWAAEQQRQSAATQASEEQPGRRPRGLEYDSDISTTFHRAIPLPPPLTGPPAPVVNPRTGQPINDLENDQIARYRDNQTQRHVTSRAELEETQGKDGKDGLKAEERARVDPASTGMMLPRTILDFETKISQNPQHPWADAAGRAIRASKEIALGQSARNVEQGVALQHAVASNLNLRRELQQAWDDASELRRQLDASQSKERSLRDTLEAAKVEMLRLQKESDDKITREECNHRLAERTKVSEGEIPAAQVSQAELDALRDELEERRNAMKDMIYEDVCNRRVQNMLDGLKKDHEVAERKTNMKKDKELHRLRQVEKDAADLLQEKQACDWQIHELNEHIQRLERSKEESANKGLISEAECRRRLDEAVQKIMVPKSGLISEAECQRRNQEAIQKLQEKVRQLLDLNARLEQTADDPAKIINPSPSNAIFIDQEFDKLRSEITRNIEAGQNAIKQHLVDNRTSDTASGNDVSRLLNQNKSLQQELLSTRQARDTLQKAANVGGHIPAIDAVQNLEHEIAGLRIELEGAHQTSATLQLQLEQSREGVSAAAAPEAVDARPGLFGFGRMLDGLFGAATTEKTSGLRPSTSEAELEALKDENSRLKSALHNALTHQDPNSSASSPHKAGSTSKDDETPVGQTSSDEDARLADELKQAYQRLKQEISEREAAEKNSEGLKSDLKRTSELLNECKKTQDKKRNVKKEDSEKEIEKLQRELEKNVKLLEEYRKTKKADVDREKNLKEHIKILQETVRTGRPQQNSGWLRDDHDHQTPGNKRLSSAVDFAINRARNHLAVMRASRARFDILPDDTAEAITAIEEATQVAQQSLHPQLQARVALEAGIIYHYAGDIDQSNSRFDDANSLAADLDVGDQQLLEDWRKHISQNASPDAWRVSYMTPEEWDNEHEIARKQQGKPLRSSASRREQDAKNRPRAGKSPPKDRRGRSVRDKKNMTRKTG